MPETPLDLGTDRNLERSPEKGCGSTTRGGVAAAAEVAGPDGAKPPDPLEMSGTPLNGAADTAYTSSQARDPATAPLPDDDQASHDPGQIPGPMSGGGFGTLLEPVLRRACQDRLGDLSWFRTPWQRGGAVTGYSTFRDDDGAEHPVVVKMPVPPCERHWLVALQPAGDIAPRVYAHGEALNGYDLAWVVMERLPHGPLGPNWKGSEFDLLIDAVGRFYAATHDHPPHGEPMSEDWEKNLDRSRRAVRDGSVPDAQRWQQALKKAAKKVKAWAAAWDDRPIDGWCHGDLHLGNAMSRSPAEDPGAGGAVLLDYALTRVGHWVQDAIYFEHLYWGHRDRLAGRKLAKQIAAARRQHGLPVASDWADLAQVKRALLALSAPAKLGHESSPRYLAGALEVLEREV